MAIMQDLLDYIQQDVLTVYSTVRGLRMLEFGDQILRPHNLTGKQYWTRQGFSHTSVDLNGQRGAEVRDLSDFAQFADWQGQFDVVYNIGTTEHVEPRGAQYTAFRIADWCCRVGGVMIHGVPCVHKHDRERLFQQHCHYYYSPEFFQTLKAQSNYTSIADRYTAQHLVYSAFQKTHTSEFMTDKDLFLSKIAVRNTKPTDQLNLKISRLQDNNYIHQESDERLEEFRLKQQANLRQRILADTTLSDRERARQLAQLKHD